MHLGVYQGQGIYVRYRQIGYSIPSPVIRYADPDFAGASSSQSAEDPNPNNIAIGRYEVADAANETSLKQSLSQQIGFLRKKHEKYCLPLVQLGYSQIPGRVQRKVHQVQTDVTNRALPGELFLSVHQLIFSELILRSWNILPLLKD